MCILSRTYNLVLDVSQRLELRARVWTFQLCHKVPVMDGAAACHGRANALRVTAIWTRGGGGARAPVCRGGLEVLLMNDERLSGESGQIRDRLSLCFLPAACPGSLSEASVVAHPFSTCIPHIWPPAEPRPSCPSPAAERGCKESEAPHPVCGTPSAAARTTFGRTTSGRTRC